MRESISCEFVSIGWTFVVHWLHGIICCLHNPVDCVMNFLRLSIHGPPPSTDANQIVE